MERCRSQVPTIDKIDLTRGGFYISRDHRLLFFPGAEAPRFLGMSEQREFILDAALGRLARYLRMLGYDAVYLKDAAGPDVLRETLRTGRTLLTRRRDLAERPDIETYLVKSDRVLEQLAEVAVEFGLGMTHRAMTRCIECNVLLEPVAKEDVLEELPPHVRKTQNIFSRCPGCGRIYWPGTHFARSLARLMRALETADG
jgi:uncharacterized protein with PIN domain